jgi:hypothetical protein
VLKPGGSLRLAAETGMLLSSGVFASQDQLKRHDPVELDMPRLIDDAHSAAGNFFEHLVVADTPAATAGLPIRAA